MEQKLPREIDFTIEAANAEKCRTNFKDSKDVIVPQIFMAKPRLLVMSFERGTSVAHVREMHAQGFDLREVSHIIAETFVKMTFVDGFVHGDPHPGNLIVRKHDSHL
jgi:aarF domain-containing kinase